MCKETEKALQDVIAQLARLRGLELGLDPTTFADLTHLIWKIQLTEGNSRCFLMRNECSEERCCWKKLCMKDSW